MAVFVFKIIWFCIAITLTLAQNFDSLKSTQGLPLVSGEGRASEILPYFLLANTSNISISLIDKSITGCAHELEIYDRTMQGLEEVILRSKSENQTITSETKLQGWNLWMSYYNLSKNLATTSINGHIIELKLDGWTNIQEDLSGIYTILSLRNKSWENEDAFCDYLLIRKISVNYPPIRNFSGWEYNPSTLGYLNPSISDQNIRLLNPLEAVKCPVEIRPITVGANLKFQFIYGDGKVFNSDPVTSPSSLTTLSYRNINLLQGIPISSNPTFPNTIQLSTWSTVLRSYSKVVANLVLDHGFRKQKCNYQIIDYFYDNKDFGSTDERVTPFFWHQNPLSFNFIRDPSKSSGIAWSTLCPETIALKVNDQGAAEPKPMLLEINKWKMNTLSSYSLKILSNISFIETARGDPEVIFDIERNRSITMTWWRNLILDGNQKKFSETVGLSMLATNPDDGHIHCAYNFSKQLPSDSLTGDQFLLDYAYYQILPWKKLTFGADGTSTSVPSTIILKAAVSTLSSQGWLFIRIDPGTIPDRDYSFKLRDHNCYKIIQESTGWAMQATSSSQLKLYSPVSALHPDYMSQIWVIEKNLSLTDGYKIRSAKFTQAYITTNSAITELILLAGNTQTGVHEQQLFKLNLKSTIKLLQNNHYYAITSFETQSLALTAATSSASLSSSTLNPNPSDNLLQNWLFIYLGGDLWTIYNEATQKYLSITGTNTLTTSPVAYNWKIERSEEDNEILYMIRSPTNNNCYLSNSASICLTGKRRIRLHWKYEEPPPRKINDGIYYITTSAPNLQGMYLKLGTKAGDGYDIILENTFSQSEATKFQWEIKQEGTTGNFKIKSVFNKKLTWFSFPYVGIQYDARDPDNWRNQPSGQWLWKIAPLESNGQTTVTNVHLNGCDVTTHQCRLSWVPTPSFSSCAQGRATMLWCNNEYPAEAKLKLTPVA